MVTAPLQIGMDVDVSQALQESGLRVSAEIIAPSKIEKPLSAALFCLPGGGTTREFFDLKNGHDASFSFAEAMIARGFLIVLINHLGIGGSSRPRDGFDLTPDVLADANAIATRSILERIRSGSLLEACPSAPSIAAFGVGHSMGAKLLIEQQARDPLYDGLVLLGFGQSGLRRLTMSQGGSMGVYLGPTLRT